MARSKTTEAPADGAVQQPSGRAELIVPRDYSNSRLVPPRGTPLQQCPTSLDMTSHRGFSCGFNAMGCAVNEMAASDVVECDVADWLIHWRDRVDEETGEISEYPCLVLISPDGSAMAFTSEVVLHRWADLLEAVAAGAVGLPVRVRISSTKARRTGRTYHQLAIVLREDE